MRVIVDRDVVAVLNLRMWGFGVTPKGDELLRLILGVMCPKAHVYSRELNPREYTLWRSGICHSSIAELGRNLSELIKRLPKRYSYKKAVAYPEKLKKMVLNEIIERVYEIDGEILMIDGIRVTLQDGSWVLFRPSGTESVFRCHVEAITHQRLNKLKELALRILYESFRGAGTDWDLIFN